MSSHYDVMAALQKKYGVATNSGKTGTDSGTAGASVEHYGKGNKDFYIHEVYDSDGSFVFFDNKTADETKKSASVSRQLNYGADADSRGTSSEDNVPQTGEAVKQEGDAERERLQKELDRARQAEAQAKKELDKAQKAEEKAKKAEAQARKEAEEAKAAQQQVPESLMEQLLGADAVTFKLLFAQVQTDFQKMMEALGKVKAEDPETGEKLAKVVTALLDKVRGQV